MTVEYNHVVATSRGLGNYGRLLLRWRGSIYKLVYPDLLVYLALYMGIFCLYRFFLKDDPTNKEKFELLVKYCAEYGQVIPVSFVLGFYISQIVTRWWSQFMTCPWPDTMAVLIATHLQGSGVRSRLMRRTIMRYMNLSFTMTMIMMSPQAKARFPSLDHLVEAGFLLPHEKVIIEHLNQKSDYSKYWIPLIWAGNVVQRARREDRIADDMALNSVVKAITKFRGGLGDLLGFDWVNIPLVYTQVVTLAVYLYFLAGLFGKQIIIPSDQSEDTYFPVFLFAEFFFYMGWLKVAETMVNPWGEDDDDFEVNWLIDRNFTVAYLIVDEMHAEHPEMLKDTYWDDVVPEEMPYTEATMRFKRLTHLGSTQTAKDRMGADTKSQFYGSDGKTLGSSLRRRANSVFYPGTDKSLSGKGPVEEYGSSNAVTTNRSLGQGSQVVSVSGGSISPSQKTSSSKYKDYMDKTFVPMNKDVYES